MTYQIDFHPAALLELEESYNWYEERLSGLGDRLVASVNDRLSQIAINPLMYPKKKGEYREVAIDKFPFTIIYEALRREKIIFVSYVFHTSRNPKLKYRR